MRRFVTKGTIENDMLAIQDKKRLVFEGTVDGNTAPMAMEASLGRRLEPNTQRTTDGQLRVREV